jgi:hypothetical protein
MNRSALLLFVMLAGLSCFGQAKIRKMPNNINHPAINVSTPYISFDGNTLIFISDYGEDNSLVMNYTTKVDAVNWKSPVVMPKNVNSRLNFLKGFSLSQDGKVLYVTSLKSGGLGGYDIHFSTIAGSTWADLKNFGAPINSNKHEGAPSIAADGTTLYFMRCDQMNASVASACKIMLVKKKTNGQWDEPVELPTYVNTGNSQVPRIMGDGETLIFSSDKFATDKGGMDLYATKWNGAEWSRPIALDFANTSGDDQYVSATSLGRYLMKDAPGPKKTEIVELLFPAEIKPKGTMKIGGKIVAENPAAAYIAVFNQKDQSRVYTGRPYADGSFTIYLKEGDIYDLSVEPEKDNFTFFSKKFDLTGEKLAISNNESISLKPLSSGDSIELSGLSFNPFSSELTTTSTQELRRLVRMIKGNPAYKFNIDVSLFGLDQDSLKSNPDLTELRSDSLKITVPFQVIDSLTVPPVAKTITRDSVVVKHTYSNDRTANQGLEILNYLVSQGIPGASLLLTHHAAPEPILENRKTIVKVIAR